MTRVSKPWSPSNGFHRNSRWVLAAALALGLGACADSKPAGTIGYVKGFGGVVAADEPRAAIVGRDVLSAGGSAADAAVAMYFTMAVTLPSTASLGGGGVCVVHDFDSKTVEVLDFLARPSSVQGAARVETAVPANVRGFYALYAKYGKTRWEGLLMEPERLARLGTQASRAFIYDYARSAQMLANDPGARQVFFPNGRPLAEGQTIEQYDLAQAISWIRRAPGDFYTGTTARELVNAVTQAGGTLTAEDLRAVQPQWVKPIEVKLGNDIAYFAPAPAVGSAVAAQLTSALADRWKDVSADERQHLVAETAARAFAARSQWMRPDGWPKGAADAAAKPDMVGAAKAGYDPARHNPVSADKPTDATQAAGLVVMDSNGNSVACNVTTYGMFGAGMVAPGTGIVMAASPGRNTGPAGIAPVLVVNPHVHETHFAAAASGGITAPTALAQVLLGAQVDGTKLDKAQAAPRVHHSGTPDLAVVEPPEQGGDPSSLAKRGHEVRAVAIPARVNAFQCDSGRAGFSTCRAESDPRGFGLSAVVGRD
jgi:gamma-glutamyltranspeptidase/glutathione hydrolase